MDNRKSAGWLMGMALSVLFAFLVGEIGLSAAEPSKPFKITVLGDLHLPGNRPEAKKRVLQTIDSEADVDMVVAVGDLCRSTGTEAEYSFVKGFLADLEKPLLVINGNHDFVFQDKTGERALTLGTAQSRSRKLDLFLRTFGMEGLYFAKKEAGYHLVFLAPDDLEAQTYCPISTKQLQWFDWILHENPDLPTIVFFHAPVWGKAVTDQNPALSNFVAQPIDKVGEILRRHPQVFLWVCGHVHMGVNHPLLSSPLNVFDGRINNVIACDLDGRSVLSGMGPGLQDHEDLWTRSLILLPDKVTVRTYDHRNGRWLDELERSFPVPHRAP